MNQSDLNSSNEVVLPDLHQERDVSSAVSSTKGCDDDDDDDHQESLRHRKKNHEQQQQQRLRFPASIAVLNLNGDTAMARPIRSSNSSKYETCNSIDRSRVKPEKCPCEEASAHISWRSLLEDVTDQNDKEILRLASHLRDELVEESDKIKLDDIAWTPPPGTPLDISLSPASLSRTFVKSWTYVAAGLFNESSSCFDLSDKVRVSTDRRLNGIFSKDSVESNGSGLRMDIVRLLGERLTSLNAKKDLLTERIAENQLLEKKVQR